MYQALYRKYRPTSFEDVMGQDVIVKILTNSIKNNFISHAYLFSGPRGTGKTSVAKIFAKAINCTNIKSNGDACDKCANCLSTMDKECVDIIEIDAASNNGVDDIRDIKNKINLTPASLKYKVYIVDEVHMLSSGAFNALLKTLEEPPEHVIFILATTEVDKIPITILSRCQLLEFHLISDDNLKRQLIKLCNNEKIMYEEEAIDEIVEEAAGSLRDGISILDKVRTFSVNSITYDDVRTICGKPSGTIIDELIINIISENYTSVIFKLREIKSNGYDLFKVMGELISGIKDKEACPNKRSIMEKMINLYDKMCNSMVDPLILCEIFFMNENTVTIDTSNIGIELENDVEEQKISAVTNIETSKETFKLNRARINNTFCEANKIELSKVKEKWKILETNTFDKKCGAFVCNLIDCMPVLASTKYLILVTPDSKIYEQYNIDSEKYEQIVKKILNFDLKIYFISDEIWKLEKQKYIENVMNKVKYEYIEETQEKITNVTEKSKNNSKVTKKIDELFE